MNSPAERADDRRGAVGRVVVAPDTFKGSLPAPQVAAAIAEGLRAVAPWLQIVELPVADGGEGTVDAALAAGFQAVTVGTVGATGQPRQARFALAGDVAIVELAQIAGRDSLPDNALDPMRSGTFGVGLVIAAALDRGASTIVLGLGGSVCTDGGAGMLQALGISLRDHNGIELPAGGAALARLASIHTGRLDPRLARTRVIVASDVNSVLLGPHGAAPVFGPQKGASPQQVLLLQDALARWARLTTARTGVDHMHTPGAGAAGGTGFGALAYLGASIEPGARFVLRLLKAHEVIAAADLVITGEGSFDRQTLAGKAPAAVITLARDRGRPVVVVAGRCTLSGPDVAGLGVAEVHTLLDHESDEAVCMTQAPRLLTEIGRCIAGSWSARRRAGPG